MQTDYRCPHCAEIVAYEDWFTYNEHKVKCRLIKRDYKPIEPNKKAFLVQKGEQRFGSFVIGDVMEKSQELCITESDFDRIMALMDKTLEHIDTLYKSLGGTIV
jgi:hypothetical protein